MGERVRGQTERETARERRRFKSITDTARQADKAAGAQAAGIIQSFNQSMKQ